MSEKFYMLTLLINVVRAVYMFWETLVAVMKKKFQRGHLSLYKGFTTLLTGGWGRGESSPPSEARPGSAYGCQEESRTQIVGSRMHLLRYMCGVSRKDRVWNDYISRSLGVADIGERLENTNYGCLAM